MDPTDADLSHMEGYLYFPLPAATTNDRPLPPIIRRCNSLSNNNNTIAENQTQRSLFPFPATGHTLPLSRTVSDPMPFSAVQTPVLAPTERSPCPRSNLPPQDPSSRRLKRIRIHRIHQEMKQLMDEMATHHDLDVNHVDDVIPDDHDQGVGSETDAGEDEVAPENEGTVSAEKVGDGTDLEFKCRCGSAYSVQMVGRNCFYKLI